MAEQRRGGGSNGPRRSGGGARPGSGGSRGGSDRTGRGDGGGRSSGSRGSGGFSGRSGANRGRGGRDDERSGNGARRPGRRPAEPRGRGRDADEKRTGPPKHGGKFGRRQFDVDAVDRFGEDDEVRVERVDERAPRKPAPRRERGVAPEIEAVGFGNVAPDTRRKLQGRLASAAEDFQRERFTEAKQKLASIEKLAPDVAEVLELRGLCKYRLGDWKGAVADLERFRLLTGSVEQHPVLADARRALGHHAMVEELWAELGEYSPEPALLEEGRIVAAGSLADQGRLQDAIRMLEKAPKPGRRPSVHHLRRWYALADLYERAGDVVTARRRFAAVVEQDPSFGDAAERAANLG